MKMFMVQPQHYNEPLKSCQGRKHLLLELLMFPQVGHCDHFCCDSRWHLFHILMLLPWVQLQKPMCCLTFQTSVYNLAGSVWLDENFQVFIFSSASVKSQSHCLTIKYWCYFLVKRYEIGWKQQWLSPIILTWPLALLTGVLPTHRVVQ